LLAPRPTLKLENHPLLAVCECLFNILTATLHIGGHSSIHNLRTQNAVLTRTHLSWTKRISDMKILIIESKIFRRIFGPKENRDVTWRIKTNEN
jgi:hypothetical protein